MGATNLKTIVITGASSGIGAATALAVAKEGHNLVIGARRMERLEQVAANCIQLGAHVVPLESDVTQRNSIEMLVKTAVEKFGRIDVMIANAGYGFLAKIHETTEEQFDGIVDTNVKGTWYVMQAAAEVMLKQAPVGRGRNARGHIIAVSSGAARRGLPLYGVYSMTKAAQLSLAEAMRVEMRGQQIYVSTVHPLTTATEFFDVASSKSRVKSKGAGHAQPVEVVARKIARLIAHPKPELWPVVGSNWLVALGTVFPRLGDFGMAKTVGKRKR